MKSRILMTVVAAGVLATGAYAYGGNMNCDGSGQKGMKSQQTMQKQTKNCGSKMSKKGMKHSGKKMMGRHGGNQMFSQLKLTDDQQFKLSILKDEMKLEMKKLRGSKKQGKMMQFVGENGFDKKAFMKNSDEKHEKMSEMRASHMEKVFKILTKEQIAELKKNLNS